jgi:hypothetical protein
MRGRKVVIRRGALFDWAHFLEEILSPYPQVRIVLSTSWVRELSFNEARSYLPPSLAGRVVGATFHRRIHGPTRELRQHWSQTPRGLQIYQDVLRRSPPTWLALDDAVDEFTPEQSRWLVACDPELGLSDQTTRDVLVERLVRITE